MTALDTLRSYWVPSQGFCILMNVFQFFAFPTLGSIPSGVTHPHYM